MPPPVPSHPQPPSRGVELWRAALDGPPAPLTPLLSPDELRRAAAFRRSIDAARFARARAILRALLGRRLGVAPARLRFGAVCRRCGADHGKPRVIDPAHPPVEFSVSHAQDRLLVAIATRPVGVDVELLRHLDEATAALVLSPSERIEYARLDPPARPAALLTCWTRKEALLKATGWGLSLDMRAISLSLRPDRPAQIRALPPECGRPEAWSVEPVDVGRDAIAALVMTRGAGPAVVKDVPEELLLTGRGGARRSKIRSPSG